MQSTTAGQRRNIHGAEAGRPGWPSWGREASCGRMGGGSRRDGERAEEMAFANAEKVRGRAGRAECPAWTLTFSEWGSG